VIPDERLATRVGAVALAVVGAAIVFFVVVYGRIDWANYLRMRVYLHATGGLQEGAPVVVGGRTIGKIEAIARSPHGAQTPLAGEEGVAITIAVHASAIERVGRGGDVFVASRGVISERYLEFGAAPAGEPYREGDQILGRDPPTLDRVLERTFDNLTLTAKFADELRPEMTALLAQLDALLADAKGLGSGVASPAQLREAAAAAVAEGHRMYDDGLGGDSGVDRLRALIDHTRATVADIRPVLDDLQAHVDTLRAAIATARNGLDARLPALLDTVQLAIDRGKAAIDKIDPMLAVASDVADRLARGEGTLGKLATDPEFPEDTKELGKLLKRQPWRIIGRPVR
jgi:ABC-type transporter Mla subunit MlaD